MSSSHANKSSDHTPKVIDLELGASLIHSTIDAAKEILKQFVEKSLPKEKMDIEQAYLSHDMKKLCDVAHKLHGGLCYCGAPRLKTAVKNLEIALKTGDIKKLDSLYDAFCEEVNALLDAYKNI